MAIPSSTFTEMVTTTLRDTGSSVTDNVSEHNALLRVMKEKGNIITVDGGYEIQRQIDYAENGSYQRFSGYDQLSTTASDVLTSTKYEWRQIALHVTASGRELNMNNGKNALINLVKARVDNAKRTAANNMSIDLYSSGALNNQIGGLANLIQNDGNGTVGGINAANFTVWQNQFREMTGTNLAATPSAANALSLTSDMNRLWLSCVRGTDKPDLIMASHDLYSLYETGLQDKQRYADAKMAAAGFETLKYKTANVVFDDNTNFATTAEIMYFINCDYLKLVQHPDAQWTQDEQKVPTNQNAIVVPLYWMGNLILTRRNVQGKLFDAS